MLSMVAVKVPYARMIERPLERLEPTLDWHCVCETPYCDCVHDCGTPYVMCLAAHVITGLYDIGWRDLLDVVLNQEMPVPWACEELLNQCKNDCERSHGDYVEFTCYGLEEEDPPSRDPLFEVNECYQNCIWRGYTNTECLMKCDMV